MFPAFVDNYSQDGFGLCVSHRVLETPYHHESHARQYLSLCSLAFSRISLRIWSDDLNGESFSRSSRSIRWRICCRCWSVLVIELSTSNMLEYWIEKAEHIAVHLWLLGDPPFQSFGGCIYLVAFPIRQPKTTTKRKTCQVNILYWHNHQ